MQNDNKNSNVNFAFCSLNFYDSKVTLSPI